jgi:hypothetical protein
MATGQLLGWGVIQNFRRGGQAKIINTIFNAQFFSKNKIYYYYLKIKFSSLNGMSSFGDLGRFF